MSGPRVIAHRSEARAGAHGIERLMEPGVQGNIGWPLDAIAGPISLPSLGQGLYVSDGIVGGVTGRPLAPGTTVVATLSLQVTGSPGVYTVGLADAAYIPTAQPDTAVPVTDTLVLAVQIAPWRGLLGTMREAGGDTRAPRGRGRARRPPPRKAAGEDTRATREEGESAGGPRGPIHPGTRLALARQAHQPSDGRPPRLPSPHPRE